MKRDTIVAYIIVVVLVASYFMAKASPANSSPVFPDDAGLPVVTLTPGSTTLTPDAYPIPPTFTRYPTPYYPPPVTPSPSRTPAPQRIPQRLPMPVIIITVGP